MTKEEILLHYESQVERAKKGQENPLNIYGKLNDLYKGLDELRKELQQYANDETDKYGKNEEIIFGDYEYEKGGREHIRYSEDEVIQHRKKLVKKACHQGEPVLNEKTGEMVEPVTITYSKFPIAKYIGDKR